MLKTCSCARCCIFLILVVAISKTLAEEQQLPSLEMLSFIAEFDDIDDETFAMLIFHALEDSKKNAHEGLNAEQAGVEDIEENDDE